MKKLFPLLMAAIMVVFCTGCSDGTTAAESSIEETSQADEYFSYIKNYVPFPEYSSKSFEEAFNSYFDNPEWEEDQFVTFFGKCVYEGEYIDVEIPFYIDYNTEEKTVYIGSCEITSDEFPELDEEETDEIIMTLISEAFELEEIITISIAEYQKSFEENPIVADEKYKNKIIEVTGEVGAISQDSNTLYVLLMEDVSSVMCAFAIDQLDEIKGIKNGDIITIRGMSNGDSFPAMGNCVIVHDTANNTNTSDTLISDTHYLVGYNEGYTPGSEPVMILNSDRTFAFLVRAPFGMSYVYGNYESYDDGDGLRFLPTDTGDLTLDIDEFSFYNTGKAMGYVGDAEWLFGLQGEPPVFTHSDEIPLSVQTNPPSGAFADNGTPSIKTNDMGDIPTDAYTIGGTFIDLYNPNGGNFLFSVDGWLQNIDNLIVADYYIAGDKIYIFEDGEETLIWPFELYDTYIKMNGKEYHSFEKLIQLAPLFE